MSLAQLQSRFPGLTKREAEDILLRVDRFGVAVDRPRYLLSLTVPTAYDLAVLAVLTESRGYARAGQGSLVLAAVRALLDPSGAGARSPRIGRRHGGEKPTSRRV